MTEYEKKPQMPKGEALKLKQKVFNKLEKHARMTKLERALGIKEEHLHNWLNAWEGEQVEEDINPYGGLEQFNNPGWSTIH